MNPPVILGSGPNGLTAAFYLARAGLRPIVLEKNAEVGGGASTRELHPGFRVPAFTHEVLLHQFIAAEMDLRAHGLELLRPAVDVFAPSTERPPVTIYADAARTAAALRRNSANDAGRWRSYRESMERAAGVIAPLLAAAPPHVDGAGLGDVWQLLKTARRVRALGHRQAAQLLRWTPMPVFDFAQEWFENPLLQSVIAGPAVSGSMLAPRSSGSTLVLLLREAHAHLAGGFGLHVKGGPGECTRAMASAARAAGADIRTGVAIERILTSQGRVTGVVAGGTRIEADTVLSSLDPRTTCLSLIDDAALPTEVVSRFRNYRAVGTLGKVHLALSGVPAFARARGQKGEPADEPHLLAGRIHLGEQLDDLERAFDAVKYGEISSQPWLSLSIPSMLDNTLAPAGAHVASIYVHNVPWQLHAGDWNTARDVVLQRTLDVLERYAPGIRRQIVAAEVLAPVDIAGLTGTSGGHIFHGELAPDQLLAVRPVAGYGHYAGPVTGLYFCGAGSHPGGFMTGASGRLGALTALETRRR